MKAKNLLICGLLLASGNLLADGPRMPPELDKTWLEECGSCHVAYPPSMLSADNWRRMMGGLDKHFGANASLDAPSAAKIGAFLERNASTRGERNASSTLRITDTRWFVREHDEVSPAIWRDPRVKNAANCIACHRGADRGQYDEHDIVIPVTRR